MSTKETIRVLLVEDNPGDAGLIREMLAESTDIRFVVDSAERLAPALARIGQGGIDVVLLDLLLPDSAGLSTFLQVRSKATEVPIMILSGLQDEQLALKALREGAQDYVVKGTVGTDALVRCIRYAVERHRTFCSQRHKAAAKKPAHLIGFIGAKGGVGTTTIVLNVASVLARRAAVIAVELHPFGGTLSRQLRVDRTSENLESLLKIEPARIREADVNRGLWKVAPGLRVLFGPQRIEAGNEISAERAEALVHVLTGMADHVILDLPSTPSEANQAAVRRCDSLLLVVERDPGAVASAKWMLEFLRTSGRVQGMIGAVIVNRTPLACPTPLAEIALELNTPLTGVIPPEPDLCLMAQKVGSPAVSLQPESAVAGSLVALAQTLVEKPALCSVHL